jgi:branched-subunit amino acid ABC-type transport system permease component
MKHSAPMRRYRISSQGGQPAAVERSCDFLFALLLEPFLFRHLYGKLMESILATWGLSIALRQG